MSDRSEVILQHNGIFTRLQAKAEGIIRVTRTRREHFLPSISPVVVCDDIGSGFHVHTPVGKPVEVLYNGQAVTVQLQEG